MPKISRQIAPKTSLHATASEEVLKKMREEAVEDAAETLAQESGLPYHDLHLFPVDADDIALIPETDARRLHVASFQKKRRPSFGSARSSKRYVRNKLSSGSC